MKKVLVAFLAFGTVFALVPLAIADSFALKTSGSNSVANLNTKSGDAGFGIGVDGNGNFVDRKDAQSKPGMDGRAASRANGLVPTGEGKFSLDALLSSGNSSTATQGTASALEDVSGNELSLLSSGLSVRQEVGAPGSGHFSFADKQNARANGAVTKGAINQAATAVTLAETPEPESLFLLGTGLLCMALALFWKSAKRQTES